MEQGLTSSCPAAARPSSRATRGSNRSTNDLVRHPERRRQLDESLAHGGFDAEVKYGTVGAVAVDSHGHVAAATSTGGLTAKRWGRIGDSPLIGAGTYADDRAAAFRPPGQANISFRAVAAIELASGSGSAARPCSRRSTECLPTFSRSAGRAA
jgi:beta-aspartyl-peptidase (threonine type)